MANNKKITLEARLRDKQATEALRRLSARFSNLYRPIDKLNRKLIANERALKPISNNLDRLSKKYRKLGKSLSMGLTLPITLAGGAVAKVATDFETAMIRVKALTGANYLEFEKLNETAKNLGATTQFSATQAADGMSFLGMAGFKTNEILKALPGVLDLAAAAQLELSEASDFSSNILTSFGKDASQMSEISDKLTYAFTNSNTTLTELHNGLSKVGGVAVKAGISFEDMTSSMMALADSGHKGETAGVALAGALARVTKFSMEKNANKVTKTFADLGIARDEFLNSDGVFSIKFQDFIRLLDSKNAKLHHYQKIFGQDAGKYIVGLSGKFEKLEKYMHGINHNSKGLTKNIAGLYMSGTSGGFKLMVSAFEGLMVRLGETGFLKLVNAVLRSFANLLSGLSSLSLSTLRFSMIFAGFLAVLGPGIYSLGLVFGVLTKLTACLALANIGFFALGLKIFAITSLILGLSYGAYLLYANWEKVMDWFGEKWGSVKESFLDFATFVSNWLKQGFTNDINFAINKLNSLLSWFSSVGKKLGFDYDIPTIKPMDMPYIEAFPSVAKRRDKQALERNFFSTDNIFDFLLPQPAPALAPIWSGMDFTPKAMETQWAPGFIQSAFEDVFADKEISKPLVYRNGYNFEAIKNVSNIEKGELDINIKMEGANENTVVTAKNRSKSRVSLDTGRVMVGA